MRVSACLAAIEAQPHGDNEIGDDFGIGIVQHNRGGLAAEFKPATAQIASANFADAPPRRGASGKRDYITGGTVFGVTDR